MDDSITIPLLNSRGFITHAAEATALIREMEVKPMLVIFNETFLTRAVGEVELEGYAVVARGDRRGQWGGGEARESSGNSSNPEFGQRVPRRRSARRCSGGPGISGRGRPSGD